MPNPQAPSPALPKILYHYTTQSGLLGILSAKKIWATQIHYLNDTKEFWHALEVAEASLSAGIGETEIPDHREKLISLRAGLETLVGADTCVVSFSESRDSLGQWRGYGGNQPGFAIGFDFEKLKRIALVSGGALDPCMYGSNDQMDLMGALIAQAVGGTLSDLRGFIHPVKGSLVYIADGEFSEKLGDVAPLMKHAAFEEEQEWRIVCRPRLDMPIKHRPGHSMLLPYVEINLLCSGVLECISEIVVGPCPNPKLAEKSLESLLNATHDLAGIPRITSSRAPYRYW